MEKTLFALVAVHLVFLPWGMGDMHVWSQELSLLAALITFFVSLLPRDYSGLLTGDRPYRLTPWPRLVRFPIFWLGLALMAYILIQALNPAWIYCTNGTSWWLQGIPHISWLPAGMETPFARANPWRSLMILASVWMTVCAIWTGFTRRRSLHRLLLVIALNGVALSALGIAQKLSHATEILWHFPAPAGYFFATIIYKNHAAGFLNLTLAVAVGLALWYRRQGERRLDRSDPGVVMLLAVLTIFVGDLFTNSRLGMSLGGIGVLAGIGTYLTLTVRHGHATGNPAPAVIVGGIVVVFAAVGFSAVSWTHLLDRFQRLAGADEDISITARIHARDATWRMFLDQPVLGFGAGSFRYYFPVYQRDYQDLYEEKVWNGHELVTMRKLWQFAHNDYIQALAEYGLMGGALIAAMILYWVVRLGRRRRWLHPIGFGAALAAGMTAVHCWADFELHNPAILITLGAILTAATGWVILERQRRNDGLKV